MPSWMVHPPELALAFAAPPGRLDTLPPAVPDVRLRCLACLELASCARLPSDLTTMAAVPDPHARSSLSGFRGPLAKDLPDPPRLPPLGFLAPSTACASPRDRSRGSSPPGILQPDPGFEVHGVSARGLPARRLDPKAGRSSLGPPGAFPPCVHTLRRLLPRRQPYRLTTAVALLPFTTPPASVARSELHVTAVGGLHAESAASPHAFASGLPDGPIRTAHPRRSRAFPPASTRRHPALAPA